MALDTLQSFVLMKRRIILMALPLFIGAEGIIARYAGVLCKFGRCILHYRLPLGLRGGCGRSVGLQKQTISCWSLCMHDSMAH
jgi:hypothetical protein